MQIDIFGECYRNNPSIASYFVYFVKLLRVSHFHHWVVAISIHVARDLYLLDQSGETTGPGGRRLRWAAGSGTRQAGVLTTVAKSGQQQRYWGIAVESGRSESGRSEEDTG